MNINFRRPYIVHHILSSFVDFRKFSGIYGPYDRFSIHTNSLTMISVLTEPVPNPNPKYSDPEMHRFSIFKKNQNSSQ